MANATGAAGCAYHKSNPGILMMQSAQDWLGDNASGRLDAAREVLYHHHPWFGRRVCVHVAVDKVGCVVFRCTLDGSQADRWLEVPAWMFDRTACPNQLLAAQPFVGKPFLLSI